MLVGVIFNNYKKVYCQKIAIVCPFRLLTPVLSKGGGQMQLPIDKFWTVSEFLITCPNFCMIVLSFLSKLLKKNM